MIGNNFIILFSGVAPVIPPAAPVAASNLETTTTWTELLREAIACDPVMPESPSYGEPQYGYNQ